MGATATIARSDVRAWVGDAVRGNPWRYERVRAPVPIGPLVSPLRYDVLVRVDWFEHFAAHRDAYERDFDAFADDARAHGYFTWFRDLMCPRWYPELLGDQAAFDAAWRARLRASAALHDSFARGGFDPRHPIVLYAGVRVLPTPTGKRMPNALFAGDGNHRLALVLASGRTELRPEECRIRRFLTLQPADTTPFLRGALGVTAEQYASFLALGRMEVA